MPVKDPQNYKQRGVRTSNELWEALSELAAIKGRSASREAVVAIKAHVHRAKKRGAFGEAAIP